MALKPILLKKHKQMAGSLPDSALKAEIHSLALKAIDTYDPSKGAKLSTHVFNQTAPVSRMNYTYQNMARMSEDKQQGKFKHYKKALDDLTSELLRDPTDQELATRLGWTLKEVTSLKEDIIQDIFESRKEVDSAVSNFSDDKTKLSYIKSQLDPEELKLFNNKTGGMSQEDLKIAHGVDTNKLNYNIRKLRQKVEGLIGNYDG